MRAVIVAISLLPLAACGSVGGEGTGTVSSASSTSASGSSTSTVTTGSTSTSTSTSTTPATPAPYTATQANMFDVTTKTSFDAVTAMHSLAISKDKGTLYQGDASTVAAPGGKISYDPRDGIFTVSLADTKAGITRSITFQDPAHRTTADGPRVEGQVPLLAGFNYLNVLDDPATNTYFNFFYQRPNTAGSFVSLAGFERNQQNLDGSSLSEQGVLVFGTPTILSEVPTKGAAHFDGLFLATMVEQGNSTQVQQWLNGTSAVDVDFAKRTLSLALSGTVGPAYVKDTAVPDSTLTVPSGSTFTAAGAASWTAAANAFAGKFASAGFTSRGKAIPVDFTSVGAGTTTAGASSIDGAFYGPDTKNIGGNFRIVGGIPDQRVDILGGFVGAKK